METARCRGQIPKGASPAAAAKLFNASPDGGVQGADADGRGTECIDREVEGGEAGEVAHCPSERAPFGSRSRANLWLVASSRTQAPSRR